MAEFDERQPAMKSKQQQEEEEEEEKEERGREGKEEEEERQWGVVGAWPRSVPLVRDGSEEVLLLWAMRQPTLHRPNAFVLQTSSHLRLDSCGVQLSLAQDRSSLSHPGVTGGVLWDSAVVLAKFLEHAVDSGLLHLQGAKIVELGDSFFPALDLPKAD